MNIYRNLILLIVMFCATINVRANSWQLGIQAYESGAYLEAIQHFENIEDYFNNPAIMYNLGNAYLKVDKIGKAIWSYEKALSIEPSNLATWNNINLARTMIVNPYEDANQRLNSFDKLIYSLPSWLWISMTLLITIYASYLLFVKKKTWIAIVSLSGSLLFLLISISSLIPKKSGKYAIVLKTYDSYYQDMQQQMKIDRTIPEGTKVEIIEHGDDTHIRLPNGLEGFVKYSDLAVI